MFTLFRRSPPSPGATEDKFARDTTAVFDRLRPTVLKASEGRSGTAVALALIKLAESAVGAALDRGEITAEEGRMLFEKAANVYRVPRRRS